MQRFVQVDAFADRPFAGNPAAVCVLDSPAPNDWMQLVAREMNLSETAFLSRVDNGYRLRWFTPSVEVDLCGHATLASAHVLWEDQYIPSEHAARFVTNSGILTCQREGDWIRMDFPSEPAVERYDADAVAHALGAPVRGAWRNRFDILVELENARAVRNLNPDLARVGRLPARGVIVTARSEDPAFDFESRFFGPAAGVPEDPVTGSAHCFLAPFWGERLGRVEMTGYQASARSGVVKVELAGERVILRGQAVTVARGEILAMPAE